MALVVTSPFWCTMFYLGIRGVLTMEPKEDVPGSERSGMQEPPNVGEEAIPVPDLKMNIPDGYRGESIGPGVEMYKNGQEWVQVVDLEKAKLVVVDSEKGWKKPDWFWSKFKKKYKGRATSLFGAVHYAEGRLQFGLRDGEEIWNREIDSGLAGQRMLSIEGNYAKVGGYDKDKLDGDEGVVIGGEGIEKSKREWNKRRARTILTADETGRKLLVMVFAGATREDVIKVLKKWGIAEANAINIQGGTFTELRVRGNELLGYGEDVTLMLGIVER